MTRDPRRRSIRAISRETMSLLGFPIMRDIDVNDAEDILRASELTDPEVPLDIVLHTPGGWWYLPVPRRVDRNGPQRPA